MTITAMDPKIIALQFNDCINDRDIDGLGQLMTDDHTFIDTEGRQDKGKEHCLTCWQEFFQTFPDYKNIFETITTKVNLITMTGYSTCSDKRLSGPAIWTATIRDYKVAEWHVYTDTDDNRQRLGINDDKKENKTTTHNIG